MTGRAADTFNTPHCGVIIVTIMSLNLATKIHFHYTYYVLAILANIMKRSVRNIYIKMKVWTMGLFLSAGLIVVREQSFISCLSANLQSNT